MVTFGPLLWNIFQNDLTYPVRSCELSMYADDHELFFIGQRIQDVDNLIKTKLVSSTLRTVVV